MANQTQGQGSGGGSERGFAAMDDDKQREIASKGGQSVDPEDRSFSKDRELAAEAGRKGGEASHGGGGQSSQGDGGQGGASMSGQGGVDGQGSGSGSGQGSGSSGNFADDPERASEAGRKGGEASGGGDR